MEAGMLHAADTVWAASVFKEQIMKTKHGLLFGFAVFLMAAMFSLAGCRTDTPEGWDIYITNVANGQAITSTIMSGGGAGLWAITTGSFEGNTVGAVYTYQWTKDGSPIGSNQNYHWADAAGSYTVSLTVTNNGSKTSAAVTVTGP
jgi:hypothetical protein